MAGKIGQSWTDYRGGRIAATAQLLMTRYVDRFHPAAMIADFLDEPEVLEAFRLINGAPGIAEAIVRWYGPIRATSDGFSKDDSYAGPTPLEIVRPVLSADSEEQRMALRYLLVEQEGGPPIDAYASIGLFDDYERVLSWGQRNAWASEFAQEWQAFRQAMLPFYQDMHYITHQEAATLGRHRQLSLTHPLITDPGSLQDTPSDVALDRDVGAALFGSLARDIYGAIRSNALFTLWRCAVSGGPAGDQIIQQLDVRVGQSESDKSYELVRFEDEQGQTRAYQATDDLARLMIGSLYRKPPSPLLGFMIGVKNVMAALITADPTFVLRNSTRDTLSGFVLGRAWMLPVVDTLRGAAAFSFRNESSRQWFLQGGASSTLMETAADDPEYAEPMAAFAIRSRFKRWARNSRRAYNFVTVPARALEAGTRIMQFRRMLASRATPREAALASRAVATDFANRGAADDLITFVIRTTVFLNAAIQGLNEARKVALTRSGMGGKTRPWGAKSPKFWGAGLLGLTALSAFAWYHSTSTAKNLEKYEALTTYHKSAYLHFTGVSGPQGHLRIPVPFEVGFLFQKVPEMIFDANAGLDTSDTDPVARGILPPTARHMLQTSFLLTGVPVPSAMAPVFDHLRNRNFFGTEIVPYYMMRRPPPARHFRSTPLIYISAGEALDLSPLVIKHYFEGYGGNVARNATAAAEWLLWDEEANGSKAFPSGRLRATGMAAFSTRPYRSGSRWADDYYAVADMVERKCYMVRRLDGQRRQDYIVENRSMLQLCGWKNEADKLLRPFGQTVHAWGFMNPNLSETAKENYIQTVYMQRDKLYKRAYVMAREVLIEK